MSTTTAQHGGPDIIRRGNLSRVLQLVHREGPASRAELTRVTGLNRSTVATLIAELVERGLVVESEPHATNQVGRPSPVVRLNPSIVAVAINPEVDAITLGVVGLNGKVLARRRRELAAPPSPDETVQQCVGMIAELMAGEFANARIAGIGLAVPGLVRSEDGYVRFASHLGWVDEPIALRFEEATGYPAAAANDAHLGAMAEWLFGAGRGLSDLVYLNGGASGIGGGIIANGQALGGADGHAGEFGNVAVGRDPVAGPRRLEDEATRASLLSALGLEAADQDDLDDALMTSTDATVISEVERQLALLSVSLSSAVNVLNPQLIVLGGFLASLYRVNPELLHDLVRAGSLSGPYESVRISTAALGSDLLMIGAAEIAFERILADPTVLLSSPRIGLA